MSAPSSSTPRLADRHAVVTGGGRGIGAAIASALVGSGARVTIMGRDADTLNRRAADLGDAARAIVCDVSDAESVDRAFSRARKESGDPHILVNNAGQAKSEKFVKTDRELWDRMISTNLTSAYLCTRQVLPAMLEARAGRIVNIASTAGVQGANRMTAYSAAKHGVVGLTRSLARETVTFNITVNAVCPGYTDTDMTEQGVAELMEAKNISRDDARGMITRVIPRGRMTSPDEVAQVVLFLCGPQASAITGQAIIVAGGEIT